MSTEHVHVFDFTRMLLGSAKPLFLVEVLVQLAFLYAVLVLCANCGARVDCGSAQPCPYCRSPARTTAVTRPARAPA